MDSYNPAAATLRKSDLSIAPPLTATGNPAFDAAVGTEVQDPLARCCGAAKRPERRDIGRRFELIAGDRLTYVVGSGLQP